MLIYQLEGDSESLDYITPILWDAGCQGLEEQSPFLRAYFAELVELPFGGQWLKLEDTDWLERFRATLIPVLIDRVTITPSWLPVNVVQDGVSVVLDPGMAFGTGHHETTRLAIQALQQLDLRQKRVLDVGAGSGILGIVAAKLGASVLGVDNDANTVKVATENAEKNGVHAQFVAGVLETVLDRGPFDVLVANLFAELHDVLMRQYAHALITSGDLILTGILAGTDQADTGEQRTWDTHSGRETLVLEALLREGFTDIRREQQGDWILLVARAPATVSVQSYAGQI